MQVCEALVLPKYYSMQVSYLPQGDHPLLWANNAPFQHYEVIVHHPIVGEPTLHTKTRAMQMYYIQASMTSAGNVLTATCGDYMFQVKCDRSLP